MDWLFVGGLGIVWSVFLVPGRRRGRSPRASVEEFERYMGILAETEKATGRWIVAPRKGERFLGANERARARARERRRRVFVFLLEALGISFLIGLFPPLRRMWIATGVLSGLLVLYVGFLLHLKQQAAAGPRHKPASRLVGPLPVEPVDLSGGPEDPFEDEGALVHVTVRQPRELEAANA